MTLVGLYPPDTREDTCVRHLQQSSHGSLSDWGSAEDKVDGFGRGDDSQALIQGDGYYMFIFLCDL